MLENLYPKSFVSALDQVDSTYFTTHGIKGIILDLDNTIIPWRAGHIDPATIGLIKDYMQAGLRVCVVSNAFDSRVTALLKPLGIPWVSRAAKPRRKPFIKALQILGTLPGETAVVGDQVFTDILGGNRLNLYTILVLPISKKEFIGTKLVRLVEKLLLHRLVRQGVIEAPKRNECLRD